LIQFFLLIGLLNSLRLLLLPLFLGLFHNIRRIFHRPSLSNQPTRFLAVSRPLDGDSLFNPATRRSLHIFNLNAPIICPAVDYRNVRNVGRSIDNRDVVANEVLMNVRRIGVPFLHAHKSIPRHITIHQHHR